MRTRKSPPALRNLSAPPRRSARAAAATTALRREPARATSRRCCSLYRRSPPERASRRTPPATASKPGAASREDSGLIDLKALTAAATKSDAGAAPAASPLGVVSVVASERLLWASPLRSAWRRSVSARHSAGRVALLRQPISSIPPQGKSKAGLVVIGVGCGCGRGGRDRVHPEAGASPARRHADGGSHGACRRCGTGAHAGRGHGKAADHGHCRGRRRSGRRSQGRLEVGRRWASEDGRRQLVEESGRERTGGCSTGCCRSRQAEEEPVWLRVRRSAVRDAPARRRLISLG